MRAERKGRRCRAAGALAVGATCAALAFGSPGCAEVNVNVGCLPGEVGQRPELRGIGRADRPTVEFSGDLRVSVSTRLR
jgi:hypothetical protein